MIGSRPTAILALVGLWLAGQAAPAAGSPFDALHGWAADDHAAALRAFRASCGSGAARRAGLRPACRAARAAGDGTGAEARAFFERWFEPAEIAPDGFLTGYYEPEVPGAVAADAAHRTPLLSRPDGFVARPASGPPPGWPDGMTAARRTGSGYAPFPDRAAIEEGALGGASRPVVHLADPVDAFMVHVQGSARIRLPDGRVLRVGFDGRNGHPYTPVARVLADQEGVPRAEMTADRLVAWLKAHPDRAPAVMRANRSYIFFRVVEGAAEAGPTGAAGVPLTAGRSLAVDPAAWPYGLPVWLEGALPRPGGGSEPLRRLVVAQDTGAAIVGPARGDLFLGSGAEAGAQASLVRERVRWVVLRPRPRPAADRAAP